MEYFYGSFMVFFGPFDCYELHSLILCCWVIKQNCLHWESTGVSDSNGHMQNGYWWKNCCAFIMNQCSRRVGWDGFHVNTMRPDTDWYSRGIRWIEREKEPDAWSLRWRHCRLQVSMLKRVWWLVIWGEVDGPFHLHSSSLLGHKSPLPWSSTQNTRNTWSLEMLTERKWCYLLSKYHWNSGTLHQERARRVSNNLGRVCVYLSSQTPSSVSHRGLNILLCWTSGLSFLSNCIFNQTCMTSVVQFLY